MEKTKYIIKIVSGNQSLFLRGGVSGSHWTVDRNEAVGFEFMTTAMHWAICRLNIVDFTIEPI